ncbi:MAG: c-type cytochrome [Methylobacillus sp.]|jgi:cytochrome c oxidase cbb3-type subunit 3|nr:c-type cytochrome [Methylobacillus sp.]
MAQQSSNQTTGHVWDDDLKEYTNPLPRWWLWGFYLTIIFSVVYWLMYPAWPLGSSYTKGVPGVNSVKYVATTKDGQQVEKTTHWSTRAQLMADTNAAEGKQKEWFDKVAATSYDDIAKNPDLMQFVNAAGKTLFSDNCAACHQVGGAGHEAGNPQTNQSGFFAPNLADDYWQWGGTYEEISTTITGGRTGFMPAKGLAGSLTDEQITNVANYVLSLSGEPHNADAAKLGDEIFHNPGEGGCITCHGADGKGVPSMGGLNLTDKIWQWVDVSGQADEAGKVGVLHTAITGGFNHVEAMPKWGTRLKPEQIKLLTVYVHDTLGGGQ